MGSRSISLLISTALCTGAQLLGQSETSSVSLPRQTYRVPPAMTEIYSVDVKDLMNGKIVKPGDWTVEFSGDSSGRRAETIHLQDGRTLTWVDDWLAGTYTSWSSDEPSANRLHFPMAQAGHYTCWRTYGRRANSPDVPASVQCPEFDPNILAGGPAQYCRLPSDSDADVQIDPYYGVVADEEQFHRCTSGWLVRPDTIEDLHSKDSVFGTIRGCRMSKEALGAKITDERWIEEHGIVVSEDLDNRFTHRDVVQTLLNLKFEAPDPAHFRPPSNYEVEDLQMEEVPCPPPFKQ
jgi:hypothetical protein